MASALKFELCNFSVICCEGHLSKKVKIAAHEKVKRRYITCCKEFQNKFTPPPQVQSRVKKVVYGGLESARTPRAPKQTYIYGAGASVFTGHKKPSEALSGRKAHTHHRKRPTDLLRLSSWAKC